MAYMDQTKKATLAPAIKGVLKKYKMKGSVAVENHSTLVVNIKSGPLDIIGNYNATVAKRDPTGKRFINRATDCLSVNHYWISEHYTGKVLQFLEELKSALMQGNHDNSDIQSDYFDVGWYVSINIGKWNSPYVLSR